ncbi:hypothetical protein ACJX0J_028509, partial [Zea mays]
KRKDTKFAFRPYPHQNAAAAAAIPAADGRFIFDQTYSKNCLTTQKSGFSLFSQSLFACAIIANVCECAYIWISVLINGKHTSRLLSIYSLYMSCALLNTEHVIPNFSFKTSMI